MCNGSTLRVTDGAFKSPVHRGKAGTLDRAAIARMMPYMCTDSVDVCPYLAQQLHVCEDEAHSVWARRVCAASCGMCLDSAAVEGGAGGTVGEGVYPWQVQISSRRQGGDC
jgi:hypothetical protein